MQPTEQPVVLNMPAYDSSKGQGGSAPPYGYPQQGFPVRQPRDFVAWSFFNSLFFNVCCLGFIAFVFSIKARDRKIIGDHNGAATYGKTAKSLNIAALVLGILSIILIIIIVAVSSAQMISQARQWQENTGNKYDFGQYQGK